MNWEVVVYADVGLHGLHSQLTGVLVLLLLSCDGWSEVFVALTSDCLAGCSGVAKQMLTLVLQT